MCPPAVIVNEVASHPSRAEIPSSLTSDHTVGQIVGSEFVMSSCGLVAVEIVSVFSKTA